MVERHVEMDRSVVQRKQLHRKITGFQQDSFVTVSLLLNQFTGLIGKFELKCITECWWSESTRINLPIQLRGPAANGV